MEAHGIVIFTTLPPIQHHLSYFFETLLPDALDLYLFYLV